MDIPAVPPTAVVLTAHPIALAATSECAFAIIDGTDTLSHVGLLSQVVHAPGRLVSVRGSSINLLWSPGI
jgi:hypothetical protein